MKNNLQILNRSVKLPLFKFSSGLSAPSLRVFCFIQENEIPKSPEPVRAGACLLIREQGLGFFIVQKSVGGFMPQQSLCNNCLHTYQPFDHLALQFMKFNFAVNGAKEIMQSEHPLDDKSYGYALDAAWYEFRDALQRYVESHNDDFSLIAGGK